MNSWAPAGFDRLPTPAKILLIISLALLPIGLASAWSATRGLESARGAIDARAREQALAAGEAIQNLLARNTLAMRVSANAALADGTAGACEEVRQILGVAPSVGRDFALFDDAGNQVCAEGDMGPPPPATRLAPGDVSIAISPDRKALAVRSGVINGSETTRVSTDELAKALSDQGASVRSASLLVDGEELPIVTAPRRAGDLTVDLPLASGTMNGRFVIDRPQISTLEQMFIFLPIAMWAAAAIIAWWMVHRLIIRPLRRLQGAIVDYQPGDDTDLVLPPGLGPATEIHELGGAFQRAVERIDGAEREARDALDGQRRLVREVHHRVKNNLQVVASLLSIHGRTATEAEAQAAYSAIGRRVDALSVVHRNHFAELEENRGIALRPLLTELAAGLRATAPAEARSMNIDLDLDTPFTTQDAAVAAAFLVTEIVEFAMLRKPGDAVDIALRRTSELTATLELSASVLVPDSAADDIAKVQFERILEGLARQLRSPLERKLGRYAVTLPVFPEE